jgi:hypothetical protein
MLRKHTLHEISESLYKEIFYKWRRQKVPKVQENVCLYGIKNAKAVPDASSENDDKVRNSWEHNWKIMRVKKRVKARIKNWKKPTVAKKHKKQQFSSDSDRPRIIKERKIDSKLLKWIYLRHSVLNTKNNLFLSIINDLYQPGFSNRNDNYTIE